MHRLDRGEAIVVPMPSPLAYCVVATTPEAINEAKGRPHNQEVASWTLDTNQILDHVEVDPREARLLPWLLHDEGLTVLLSPRADQPIPCHWRPSYRDGRVLLFGIRWRHLEGWMTTCKRPLYISSANRTGMPSAVTTAEVRAQMPSGIFIVDGDELRDPERKHGSTTMVRFGNGALQVVRHGIHDEVFEATQEWVADLLVRASDCVRAGESIRS
jgi:tRNA A37 threonylcarbamoyladenosine synthetase subunit TsaC/SUA5/YrdC